VRTKMRSGGGGGLAAPLRPVVLAAAAAAATAGARSQEASSSGLGRLLPARERATGVSSGARHLADRCILVARTAGAKYSACT
jgi:hypothetical protein